MPDYQSDIVCRGCWPLGNNCGRCSKCCETAGEYARWATEEIRRLQYLISELAARVAAQSELLSKNAERLPLSLAKVGDQSQPGADSAAQKDIVEQWGGLPQEPCRFCRETGGVLFLIDEGPHGRESPVIVRCKKCGRHWEADSRYA